MTSGQNLDNKALSLAAGGLTTVFGLIMICLFGFRRKVRCHN